MSVEGIAANGVRYRQWERDKRVVQMQWRAGERFKHFLTFATPELARAFVLGLRTGVDATLYRVACVDAPKIRPIDN